MAQNEQKQNSITDESYNEAVSEAVMDLKEAGLSPEEALSTSQTIAAENNLKTAKKQKVRGNMASIPKVRWFILLILSLLTIVFWAIEAQYSARPYRWPALGVLVFSILLATFGAKLFRLPTRGGLVALLASATFVVSALYGPSETFFNNIPAAFLWSSFLLAIILWVMVAIWRKLRRLPVLALLLYLFVLLAASGPAWAIFTQITAPSPATFDFYLLANSPQVVTDVLPWFIWPMTIMLGGILPLAAILAFADQVSALGKPGTRHGGDFFLALAFLLLLPYGFLSYDKAMEHFPAGVQALRNIYPPALTYARPLLSTPEGDYQYAHDDSEIETTSPQGASLPLAEKDQTLQVSEAVDSTPQSAAPEVTTDSATHITTETTSAATITTPLPSSAQPLAAQPTEATSPQSAEQTDAGSSAKSETTEVTQEATTVPEADVVPTEKSAELTTEISPEVREEKSGEPVNDLANASTAPAASTPATTADDNASLAKRLTDAEKALNDNERRILKLETQLNILLNSQVPASANQ